MVITTAHILASLRFIYDVPTNGPVIGLNRQRLIQRKNALTTELETIHRSVAILDEYVIRGAAPIT